MRWFLFAAVLLLIMAGANAAQWVQVDRTGEYSLFVDAASLHAQGDSRIAFRDQRRYPSPGKLPDAREPYYSDQQSVIVNCAECSAAIAGTSWYGRDGSLILEEKSPWLEFMSLQQGLLNPDEFDFACRQGNAHELAHPAV